MPTHLWCCRSPLSGTSPFSLKIWAKGKYFQFECTKFSNERFALQHAVSVPLRTSLRCCWNMLCSLASHHPLLLAGSKYQMEISHRSSPKTAPTLSQQQTFMAYSLRHLCPPNNSSLQICLHMQSNQTALSRDACFLVALFLEQPLLYHPLKKGAWFHCHSSRALWDILFKEILLSEKKILLLFGFFLVSLRILHPTGNSRTVLSSVWVAV